MVVDSPAILVLTKGGFREGFIWFITVTLWATTWSKEREMILVDVDDLFRASPEYLVRTGSLKNKVIPADTSRSLTASSGLTSPSNYAVYNIQTGCFTWQGRSGRASLRSPNNQFYLLELIIRTPT